MLSKIKVNPGINRDMTNYTNSGGWFDSDYIRFRNGMPEKIGGWVRIYQNQTALIGKCRKMYDWSSLTGNQFLAVPTETKFYVDNGSSIIDITPLRRSVTLGTNPIATTNGSSIVTITDVNHGATAGDYLTISGALGMAGIPANLLNKEFTVTSVVNSNAYTVTTTGTATSTSAGGGGTGVSVAYQFYRGISSTVTFQGWGSGPWGGVSGSYGWGYGPATTVSTYYSGLWTVDNYGEDMIACPRDLTNGTQLGNNPITSSNTTNTITVTQINHGYTSNTAVVIGGVNTSLGGIPASMINGTHTISVTNANAYTFTVANVASSTEVGGTSAYVYTPSIVYWDITDNDGPAVPLGQLGAAYAKLYLPYVATEVMVSDQNRQVICFGCNPYDTMQSQDKMTVRWSDSNDPTNWDIANTTKTAGEQRLSSGSYIITATQNREEVLVWTDTALFSMVYTGPPYGYGFTLVGSNFDIIGPNSKYSVGANTFWMGSQNFYMYDGKVQPLPCTVRDYVFLDLSVEDGDKVYCSGDTGNNEVIWFYPSKSQGGTAGSREVDRYVTYNYLENVWYFGTLARTAWIDRIGHPYPRAMSTDGYLFEHENGFDNGATTPATPINAYIQSSPMEIGDGNNYLFVTRVLPDLTFRNSTTNNGAEPVVKFTIKPQDYPGGAIGTGDESTVQRNASATLKVNRFTDQVFTRLRARSVALRVESDTNGVAWRLGTPRFDMRQDGRK